MTEIKLQNELKKLRLEVDNLARDNIDAREKLNSLISEIEEKLDEPDDGTHYKTLIQNIKGNISQFETEHPRATAILNDIMVTLSNLGI
ncbi:MAG: DUF4404 family protein [Gammaproteobacteria bacterium]